MMKKAPLEVRRFIFSLSVAVLWLVSLTALVVIVSGAAQQSVGADVGASLKYVVGLFASALAGMTTVLGAIYLSVLLQVALGLAPESDEDERL